MNEGDYIVRIWPSGTMTMGIVHRTGNSLFFKSLEDYSFEGCVHVGGLYGGIGNEVWSKIRQRAATEHEVMLFNKMKTLTITKIDWRDMIINEILG